MTILKSGVVLVLVLMVLVGCTSIPERELENAFRYQRLKRSDLRAEEAIASEYQKAAQAAFTRREKGGLEEAVSLLEVGDDALLVRVHLIRSARRTIDLQTFIWKDDPTSRFVFDELVKAAERGVLVRMLVDGLNMPGDAETLAQMAQAHRNLEICLYKPLSNLAKPGTFGFWDNVIFKTRHMNRRMHNKLLLVDSCVGVVGGRNYEGKYYDRNPAFMFRDRDVAVCGPSVLDMEDSFELFWQDKRSVFLTQLEDVRAAFEALPNEVSRLSEEAFAGSFAEIDRLASLRAPSKVRPRLKLYTVDRVEYVADTPRKFRSKEGARTFDEWFLAAAGSAEKTLAYQTPYLIYNRSTRKGFNRMKTLHPELRIMASSNSLAAADHVHVYALSYKHRKQLYKKSGIDIYEAKPHPADRARYVYDYERFEGEGVEEPVLCIHSKSFAVDGKVAMIGSHNFDPRSAKLNTECALFIEDEEFATLVQEQILRACEPQNAWTVSKAPTVPVISYFSGLIGAISSALPVFDVWPYQYTTNYELKEGAAVLPPRTEGFTENYLDVGRFPEVKDSRKEIRTRLMKAFGGWARPLM